MELVDNHLCFGGQQRRYRHTSNTLKCDMTVSLFVPPGAGPFPVLWWLSGLTCNDENFVTKAGAQRKAAELGMAMICPDTSPRGDRVANDDAYDLGQGAGFYINATQTPWSEHFQMERYLTEELPALAEEYFPVDMSRQSISGHSMGGHGALTLGLKNPSRFRSISAFSPIVAPTQVPWGQKAFATYLGGDEADWKAHDATHLIGSLEGELPPILIDQGEDDPFLAEQLQPDLFKGAAIEAGRKVELNMRPGYDHSYFFTASFIDEHLEFHGKHLGV